MKEEEKKYRHGFKTPPNYFETIEASVFQKLLEDKLPKDAGFTVPEGYFSAFEKELLQKLEGENRPVKEKKLYQQTWFQYSTGIAACLILGIVLWWNPNNTETLETSDVVEYIQNDGLDLDAYDIAQLLSEEEIQELMAQENLFSEESMENYLLEHLGDSTLLTE